MAPWVKHLLCKPDNLSYSPGIIVKAEGENQLQIYSVTYIHVNNTIELIQEKTGCHVPLVPILEKQQQVNLEFKASLEYNSEF